MLQLRTEQAGIAIDNAQSGLGNYTEHLRQVYQSDTYEASESSLRLSSDEAMLEQVKAVAAQKIGSQLKYNIVVGIGGSNLGTKAVYDALLGQRDALDNARFPRLLFAETTDPEWLAQTSKLLETLSSPDEVLVTLISKSGGTTETLANFEILMAPLLDKFNNAVAERIVAITDEGSKLWDVAQAKGISCLAIPAQVGGRYSVFSPVGLLPLLSVGIDIEKLRQGAQAILEQCLGAGQNSAAQSATILAGQLQQGRSINDNFFFHPELESVGKWYRQLMGESVGKEASLTGEIIHTGITPTVSLGSTDLHSVGQLYLGGPRDKITTFVSSQSSEVVTVPATRFMPELVPMINGKSAADIMAAILDGVKVAYQKAELPYMEIVLDAIDEQPLGAYLQFKMLEMMYLGQLLNVNSFDQPNVEAYKIETKRLLEA
jgi:glucose-6-phosphate isomerase